MIPMHGDHDWAADLLRKVAAQQRTSAQRSSLIKLPHSALQLHIAALSCPRDETGGSKALAVAACALGTAAKNQQQENGK